MAKKNVNRNTVLTHVALWSIFITIEVTLLWLAHYKSPWYRHAVFYTIYISLFYLNTYLLLRKDKMHGWIGVVILCTIEIIAFTFFIMGIENLFRPIGQRFTLQQMMQIPLYPGSLMRELIFLGFSYGYYRSIVAVQKTKEVADLRIAQLEAVQSLLKLQNTYQASQLKPHLLFNTLYFISTREDLSEETSKSIVLLADTMRYAMTKPGPDGKIMLQKDVKQIENYIELNKLTQEEQDGLITNIHLHDSCEGNRIPPMLLLTLVENIFKHGVVNDRSRQAKISMQCKDGELELYTFNYKKATAPMFSNYIGLSRVKDLLEEFYESSSSMTVDEDENTYTMRLNITL